MRFLRLLLPLVCLTMLFIACQQLDISTSSKNFSQSHSHTQVVGTGTGMNPDGVWPPQPANMTQVGILAGNYRLQSNNVRKAALKEAIMADSSLLSELGNDYLLLDVNISTEKDDTLIQEVILFSYSNNNTIRAWLTQDHAVEYSVMSASEYQFPETAEEIAKSIELAKSSLVSQGHSDAAQLNAHAMLTYPDEASGEQFYDVRMLYVTVGDGNGAVPVYAAWVDLTNNIVTKSGLIGSYAESR